MHILCPKCSTKFVISESQIGTNGRKVRCSKCKHIWHADTNQVDGILDAIQKTENIESHVSKSSSNAVHLPAVIPIERHITYKNHSNILLIGMITLLCTMLFASKFGYTELTQKHSVIIEDLAMEKDSDTNKIILKYKAYNNSKYTTKVPLLKVQLMDSNHKVLKTQIINNKKVKLYPNKFVWIKTDLLHSPKNTENIQVILGNRLDFLLN